MFYDKEGKPISWREYGELHADMEYRIVGQEYVGPYWVSTVWLGLDHSHSEGPPVIFETMVFVPDEEEHTLGPEMLCHRYCTEAEAKQGHDDTVTLIRATYQPIEEEEENHGIIREAFEAPHEEQEP